MKKNLFFTLFLFTLSSLVWSQENFNVNGVNIPRTIEFEREKLQLNGFGTRSKFWTELYVQALYLTVLSEDAKDILESNTNMAVRLQITSSLITPKKLNNAIQKGMIKSVGEENISTFSSQLNELEKILNKDTIVQNDAFNLIYSATEKSVFIYKNGKLLGKLPGFDFKKAFFGIWLSDNPVDEELKNELLGKAK